MITLIADVETNGLLPDMTKFWMVQLGDADGDDAVLYVDPQHMPVEWFGEGYRELGLMHEIRPLAEGLARMAAADQVVFHNGQGFDYDAIEHFHPGTMPLDRILDTLVMARLAFPQERDHTLRAWGRRVEVLKDEYHGDYQQIDADFLRYSEQDIVVGRALWNKVKHVREWGMSCWLEHQVNRAIILQERRGFMLDVRAAEELAGTLRGELEELGKQLLDVFPPIERTTTFIPKRDNRTLGYKQGVPFTKTKMEAFNPASRFHVAERLMMAGWKPTVKNKDNSWKVDADTLKELPYPEAKSLLGYAQTAKMLGQLSDGKEGWLKHVKPDGRVHGRVNPNGCVTGRMSHSKPNLGNVDKDERMRGCWLAGTAMDGKQTVQLVLVGCDAEALEARMLAHYLDRYDGGAYTKVVLEGSSKDRTDVHSANLRACIKAGLVPKICWSEDLCPGGGGKSYFDVARGRIKNLLYGMMYGAQDPKLGAMVVLVIKAVGVRVPPLAAKERGALFRKAISTSMVGLDKLTEAVKARVVAVKQLRALDGRRLPIRSQHSCLNALLQGGGAVVMKLALVILLRTAAAEGIIPWQHFWLVANVHDEWQLETFPQHVDRLKQLSEDAIRLAGQELQLRCPLAGKAASGSNWGVTH